MTILDRQFFRTARTGTDRQFHRNSGTRTILSRQRNRTPGAV
jgi:hypothetical protein